MCVQHIFDISKHLFGLNSHTAFAHCIALQIARHLTRNKQKMLIRRNNGTLGKVAVRRSHSSWIAFGMDEVPVKIFASLVLVVMRLPQSNQGA
jgi:hypothetical protein